MSVFMGPIAQAATKLRSVQRMFGVAGGSQQIEATLGLAVADMRNIPLEADIGRVALLGETISGCGGAPIADFAVRVGERLVSEASQYGADDLRAYVSGMRMACGLAANALRHTRRFPTELVLGQIRAEIDVGSVAAQEALDAVWRAGRCTLLPGEPGVQAGFKPAIRIGSDLCGWRPRGVIHDAGLCTSPATGVFGSIGQIVAGRPTVMIAHIPMNEAQRIMARAIDAGADMYTVPLGSRVDSALDDIVARLPSYGSRDLLAGTVVIDDGGTYILGVPEGAIADDAQALVVAPDIYGMINPMHRRRQSVVEHGFLDDTSMRAALRSIEPAVSSLGGTELRGARAVIEEIQAVSWLEGRQYVPVHMLGRALRQVPDVWLGQVTGTRTGAIGSGTSFVVGGEVPDPKPTTGDPPDRSGRVSRVLDVVLASITDAADVSSDAVGTRCAVFLTIRLPTSPMFGTPTSPFGVTPNSRVEFIVDARGCRLITPTPDPVYIPEAEDSHSRSFMFEIESTHKWWVSIELYQAGNPLCKATLTDADVPGTRQRHPFAAGSDVDLSLSVGASGNEIEGHSPHHLQESKRIRFGQLKQPDPALLAQLREQLLTLQRKGTSPEYVEQQLKYIGVELAKSLPTSLRDMLSTQPPAAIYLSHAADFDFPFELVYLAGASDSFFLGDRVPICRWYKDVRSAPRHGRRSISKAAVLLGKTSYAQRDFHLISGKCSAEDFRAPDEVVRRIFMKSDFDLLHFIGHCEISSTFNASLELADGPIGLISIGALPEESKFGELSPVVVLNGCGTANPHTALSGPKSFSFRFLDAKASMVVGTLWPVHESVAHHFSVVFYERLREHPLGEALRRAKIEVASAKADVEGNTLTERECVLRRISARSYCAYGHPNFKIDFAAAAPPQA